MKHTISLLLLTAMLLTIIPFSFAGCGFNKDETAEDGISESSENSLPETESSENKSQTEEREDMNKEPINTEYVNAALNKRYEKSSLFPEDKPSYPDEMGKSMTDGVIIPEGAAFSHPAFIGFNANATGYRANGYATITVDLGKVYSLDKFVAHVGSAFYHSSGINAPEFVWIYVAHDFGDWYEAGKTNHVDTEETNSIAATLELEEALTARYVQFRFFGSGNWIMVSEVEAYGREAEEPIPYPEKADEKSFLFVGNSATFYFNSAFKFKCIAESLGINVDVTSCCYGSAYLSYYADPNYKPHGDTFRAKLAAKNYDYVVLQDNSGANFETAKAAVDVMLPMIKENGAEAMLYMRYSSNDDPAQRLNSAKRHYDTYTKLAEEFGIDKIARSAEAFLICTEKYPEINLYFTDNSHHNNAGAYLIACVMAIEFLGVDITDATYTAGLDEDTASKLKECAKLACTEGYTFPENN